jgi:hypothetical protein
MPEHHLHLPPAPVETVSPVRAIALPDDRERIPPTEGDKPSLTMLLAGACEDCGLSEKESALSQGYDPKYWPRIKSGEKQAHLERIEGLPPRVRREFVKRWADREGLHVSSEGARERALKNLLCATAEVIREIA